MTKCKLYFGKLHHYVELPESDVVFRNRRIFHRPPYKSPLLGNKLGTNIADAVACPYFFPTERISLGWAFPGRLPLGAGFTGSCHALPKQATPTETELRDFCNMGYARGCARMPKDRGADGVRFAVARDEGARVILHYVSECDHEPLEYGRLEYDCVENRWAAPLRDVCLQRQAECYMAVYLDRRPRKTG